MTFADSYFQKCHQLMNENSKLRRRIMQLEVEIMDLKKGIRMTGEKRFHIINGADNLAKYGIFCKPVLEDGETGEQYILALDLMDLLNKLYYENEQLKQQNEQAIDLILDGIMEMHDGRRDYAETLFNKAINVIKNDI